MLITLRSGLGWEIATYHSSIVPRTQEFVRLAAGSDQALYKVMDVRYLIDGKRNDAVDLEVLPANEAAAQYNVEKFFQAS